MSLGLLPLHSRNDRSDNKTMTVRKDSSRSNTSQSGSNNSSSVTKCRFHVQSNTSTSRERENFKEKYGVTAMVVAV